VGKRGHNEGSIYKRDDGRWVAIVTLGYEGGKRKRKSFYGETRKDVQEQLTKALRDLQQGLPIASERLTVGDFLQRWLEDVVKGKKEPKTYASYAQLVRLHLAPELGRIALAKLSPQEVQEFINRKQAAGLSPRTIQYLHAILRAALNRALKWGLVSRNVATLVEVPSVRRKPTQFLEPEQARRLLDDIRGDRLEALYTVALAIGLREGEALGLRWQDVNLETGTITVQVGLQRVEGKLQLKNLKTEHSRRSISLPQFANAALRSHRARQLEERLQAGELWEEHGLVFTTALGKPLDSRNVVRRFKRALQQAGLPDQRFYDLRHTCASLLLVQGVHPRVVMEILGHSQISLTMNTYSHVAPQLQGEAAERMHRLLTARAHDREAEGEARTSVD
jgi:integrase